ncbi:metal-sensing transcriptional repressor [Candidatus Peregrinibacteria bacterium]|jgi:CsoR family transcriptional regulator, copper-sensing transcriptional repressor|nr:metal-sensing transcriptional repressor [Candidatus Peregrinibacteria bacterium]MBT7483409.1 metal-sensing transcriptional repressor [Candidatus Peregrinibacteria bacterium]MBT7702757.1 metal-sensing transcriptional repressor [Candidatus Peregrinibacteria bacterium]
MAHNNQKTLIAMKKAKTSLEKVIKMIEDGKYCVDVIQQNLAVIGLLRSANTGLLEGHVNHCIKDACEKGRKKDIEEKMHELMHILKIAQTK